MNHSKASQELIVYKTIELKADPFTVWDALTNPKLTKKYFFGCEVHSDFRTGNAITWTGTYKGKKVEVKGEILKVVPGELLRYTAWGKESGLEDIPSNYTHVSIRLSDSRGGTILSVTDENFGSGKEAEKRYQASVKGWDQVLTGLKELVER